MRFLLQLSLLHIVALSLTLLTAACERPDGDREKGQGDHLQQASQQPATAPAAESQDSSKAEKPDEEPSAARRAQKSEQDRSPLEKLDDLRRAADFYPETTREWPIALYDNYVELGDLDEIKKRGKLRILVDISNVDALERGVTPQDIEIEFARNMAEKLGLEPVVLYTSHISQVIPALVEGKADLVVTLIATEDRDKLIDFSDPVFETRLVLVSRDDMQHIGENYSPKGKKLTVTKNTVFATKAKEFAAQHPGIELELVDKNFIEIPIDVSIGNTDLTIIDESLLEFVRQFRKDLIVNHVFPELRHADWAVRENSPLLMEAVNRTLRDLRLTRYAKRSTAGLEAIKKRKAIRVAVRNDPGIYMMWKGRLIGYEYELIRAFAKELGIFPEFIVADEHSDLFTMLTTGEADIAAALLSKTERRRRAGMAFGPSYMHEKVGIAAPADEEIDSIEDLAGRRVYVRKSSNQYDAAMKLKEQVPDVEIELIPEELNSYQILDRVATRTYELAIVDEISFKLAGESYERVKFALDLQQQDNYYGWMMRESNAQLRQAVDQFFAKQKIKDLTKTLYSKYFDAPSRSWKEIKELNDEGAISPYDDLIKKYADQYDFDWRMIAAQMFQESSFNPKAKSWVGARGLMQVMPDTGKQVGEKNLYDPETSVRAGIKYLDWLHRKFEDKGITPDNRLWFTLASYNAGLGHVYDAQDLAEEKGWNRKLWFNNVEDAMLLLAQPSYYKKARYGYARGREPYDYVRKISARYRAYAALLDTYRKQQEAASALTCTCLPVWLDDLAAHCRLPAGLAAINSEQPGDELR